MIRSSISSALKLNLVKRSFAAVPSTLKPSELYPSLGHVFKNLDIDYPVNSGVFGSKEFSAQGKQFNTQVTPNDNKIIGHVSFGTSEDYKQIVKDMDDAKEVWANTPAPVRGEIVRQIGEELRKHKEDLGTMISLEMGKIYTEGLGEIQEAIDICDLAVGLSRSINGQIIPSERKDHIMLERYNPLKNHVGIITAFNFPVAVYFWNLALSLICGNINIWKPHEGLSLTSVSVIKLVQRVLAKNGYNPSITSLICGNGKEIGNLIVEDPKIDLVSFTGSTNVGREIGKKVINRFGKHLLELGGNNALIIDSSANIPLSLNAVLFGSVGTCGQRCTTTRRLYLHKDVSDEFLTKLVKGYEGIKVGNSLDTKNNILCGPIFNDAAINLYKKTIKEIYDNKLGKIIYGGKFINKEGKWESVVPELDNQSSPLLHPKFNRNSFQDMKFFGDSNGNYILPTIVLVENEEDYKNHLIHEERFIPVLYICKINNVKEGISHNNSVKQGLSSSLFTTNYQDIFNWTGPEGSDCGIINVNIGTSGAEIGGAFGGDKETGGGRESGSDAWKIYMRRSTCTINYGNTLPLAQGVKFE